jgi:hypothetical protein
MRNTVRWKLWLSAVLVCCSVVGTLRLSHAAVSPDLECLIPPTFDPGIGGVYFCPPSEGERHLITMARRAATETDLHEDTWVNFRGVFRDCVWINIGMQESSSTSLPAWDALTSLVTWMRAIKGGDTEALGAFLAPLEVGPTYTKTDQAVKQRLLAELQTTAVLPDEAPLRIVLYHVHLLPLRKNQKQPRVALNPWLSLPSQEDLFSAMQLAMLVPESEAKIAVPAGVWTYNWDKNQAVDFVAKYYKGRTDVPFASKFRHLYLHFAVTEYRKQGLHNPATLTPERMRDYVEALRSTGAMLHFAFAADWTTLLNK